MPFIKALITITASLLLLAGCTSAPSPSPTVEASGPAINDADTFTPAPNPYLENPKSVSKDARKRFQEALDEMQSEQWASAETSLQLLIVDYPELSGPYLNLALVLQKLDKQDAAQTALTSAIEANPKNVFAYNELALLQRKQGLFELARDNYLDALRIWPDYLDANINLAILYDLYLNDKSEAMAYYQKAAYLSQNTNKQLKGWIIDLQRQDRSSQ